MIYLLNFNITYIITLLHVSTLMSHLQAKISRPIVHIVLQFLCIAVFCRNIDRQKTVIHKNCKIICSIGLEIYA